MSNVDQKKTFDQAGYWINRHQEYSDDPRSVGNLAATYDQNLAGERELVSVLDTVSCSLSGRTVLDIGCGYGRAAGPMLKNGFQYTGIDISSTAIHRAKTEHPRGVFSDEDLSKWSPNKNFDVVLILYVLVHFVDDEAWKNLLGKAMNALSPGGTLVLADHFPEVRQSTVAHVKSRPLSEYSDIFGKHDLVWNDALAHQLVLAHPTSSQARQFRFVNKARSDEL